MKIIETTCQVACNKLKRRFPYPYDLNVYRGCQHGCKYCFALYSHDYVDGVGAGSFFKHVVVKTNIVEQLEKQLSSPSWKGDVINLGGVTDNYQPIEKEYQLMPQVLKLLIRYKNPCIISTKSDLILRDFDLIDQLSRLAHVNIACTITAFDEDVRRKLEPGGVSSAERFNVLKEMGKTKASRGVHVMPIVPYLTDDLDNLENIYRTASEINASYVLPSNLNLKGPTRSAFFAFIDKEYPHLFTPIAELFQGREVTDLRKAYKSQLFSRIRRLQDKYQLYANYMDFAGVRKKEKEEQLSLF
ncbi:DNA repair photolyase [Clostridiales Family XIII bacterium PM5-7]